MAADTLADRVRAVDLLWAFKRACDRHINDGMPMVHFRLLTGDAAYRRSMLDRALEFADPDMRRIASELKAMDAAGRIPDDITTTTAEFRSAGFGRSDTDHGTEGAKPSETPPARRAHRNSPIAAARQRPATMASVGLAALMITGSLLLYGLSGDREHVVDTRITTDTVWESGNAYILAGQTFVENGAELTIEPGVTIKGDSGSALVITRDARIFARGSRERPIVFTSVHPPGTRAAGDWGGLVLLGNAPVNRADAHVEGISADDPRGDFGGDAPGDSCGVLEFVRVEFAGFELARNVELNGLTLGGCGSATIVRHVQVHRGLDDGVEVFGGKVDLSHIVVTGADDDAFDWDMGWQGRVQFLLVQLHPDIGDNAFEADNDGDDPDAEPRSEPHFSNVTLLASRRSRALHRAMVIRRGSGGHFRNVLISGFNGEAIDLRSADVSRLVADRRLDFAGIALHASGPTPGRPLPAERGTDDDDGGFSENDFILAQRRGGLVGTNGLTPRALDPVRPVFTMQSEIAGVIPAPLPKDEFWDEGATFIGAMLPGEAADWTLGWTAYPAH